MARRFINTGLLVFAILALIIGGYTYWLHEKHFPSTDDAYIQAHIINVATQVNGKIATVSVKNQQAVKKGELLFTIDPHPFLIALQKAEANLSNTKQAIVADKNAVLAADALLAQRQADLVNARKNYHRVTPLVKKGFYAKAAGDQATQELTVAQQAVNAAKNELLEAKAKLGQYGDGRADIEAAKSAIAQAKLNLSYTKVYAPADGEVAKFGLQPGQTVVAYQSLFSLVETNTWWAMANMKETNLERIKPGQTAIIHVDMYPGTSFHGVVASISPGSGSSFALLPPENATGNWVKVTQRFPVKVLIKDPNKRYPLRLGASCSVSIDTLPSHSS